MIGATWCRQRPYGRTVRSLLLLHRLRHVHSQPAGGASISGRRRHTLRRKRKPQGRAWICRRRCRSCGLHWRTCITGRHAVKARAAKRAASFRMRQTSQNAGTDRKRRGCGGSRYRLSVRGHSTACGLSIRMCSWRRYARRGCTIQNARTERAAPPSVEVKQIQGQASTRRRWRRCGRRERSGCPGLEVASCFAAASARTASGEEVGG